MSSTHDEPRNARLGAIRSLRRGAAILSQDYWLFLGTTIVGMAIAAAVPAGVLAGPLFCGLYLCLAQMERGERLRFETLWKGFGFFQPALVGFYLPVALSLALVLPVIFGGVGGLIFIDANLQGEFWELSAFFLGWFLGLFVALLCFSMLVISLLTLPLVAGRGLDGVTALRTSALAARANLGGLVRLILLQGGLVMLGGLCCGVGAFFALPLVFASTWAAYGEIFSSPGSAGPDPEAAENVAA